MRFPDQNNDRCFIPLLGPIGIEGLRSNIHEPRNRKVLLETENNNPCRKVRSNRTTSYRHTRTVHDKSGQHIIITETKWRMILIVIMLKANL